MVKTASTAPSQCATTKLTASSVSVTGFDGVVAFPSRPGASYRYQLQSKNDALSIWLEDRKSKQQWKSDALKLEDFVKSDLVISQASFQDYVSCFLSCLQSSSESNDGDHDLVPVYGSSDAMELRLTLKLRIFSMVLAPTYKFQLNAIELAATDLLSAKLRDQEEQIVSLQGQVQQLKTELVMTTKPTAPIYVRAVATNQFTQNQTLVWKSDGVTNTGRVDCGIILQEDGGICFSVAGVFMIQAMVCNNNTNNTDYSTMELLMNGTSVVTCFDSSASAAYIHASPISHVVEAKLNDVITVVYRGTYNAFVNGTYIIIHELR